MLKNALPRGGKESDEEFLDLLGSSPAHAPSLHQVWCK